MAFIDDLATRIRDSRGANIILSGSDAQEVLKLIEGRPVERSVEFAHLDDEVGRALEATKGGGFDYPAYGNAGVIPQGGSPAIVQEGKVGDRILEERKKEREEAFEAQGMAPEGKFPEDQPANLNPMSPTAGQPVPADSSLAAARQRAGMTAPTADKKSTAGKASGTSKTAASKTAAKSAKKGAK